jgi:PAS domain S-box-containing protein
MRMQHLSPAARTLPWVGLALVALVVAATGILTNVTLRSVEKTLPNELLRELSDLSIVFEHLHEAASMAEVTRAAPTADHLARLRAKVETVRRLIVDLRETYVFDNMVQASDFHAAVAPAVADADIWLAEGVSGFDPASEATIAIVRSRIAAATEKARALNHASRRSAQEILDRQRSRLDHFLIGVNLLFAAAFGLAVFLVFLRVRQQELRARELASLQALRQAQQCLEESEELHRKLISTLPDVVIRTQLDGTIVYVNEIGLQSGGYTASDLLGRNMLAFVAPEDRERALANALRMPEGPLGPKEYDLVMKDGSRRRFEVNGDVLRHPDGTPYGLVNACRDISERHRMLQAHQELQDRLHRAEKMEALGVLAGGVAHDMNNVLGALVGYSELMLLEIPDGHPLHRHVRYILESGQRGAAIVQDLLTLARRGTAVSEVVHLNRVIGDSLETPEIRQLCAAFPQVRLVTDLDPQLLPIKGSPVHLSKTVTNLVLNAVEAMDGRGQVTLRTENRHLDGPMSGYETMGAGDYVVVSVADTGPGIAPADLAKIFEPFYSKKVMGRSGTGLGLAVVWGTVKDHNGCVDVQSQAGRGATFTLFFPATREAEKCPLATIPAESYAGGGESILVVDDEPSQRDLARRMLERIGYRVETAADGAAAVDFFKAGGTADLVILDMIMDPGIDGLETYRRIREIRPGQKTVIVSGYSESRRVKMAQALGAGPYVRKPYLLERLASAVRGELDRG